MAKKKGKSKQDHVKDLVFSTELKIPKYTAIGALSLNINMDSVQWKLLEGRNCKVDIYPIQKTSHLIGRFGWQEGFRFRVASCGIINGQIILECVFEADAKGSIAPKERWTEYHSLKKLTKEKCFQFDFEGRFLGC